MASGGGTGTDTSDSGLALIERQLRQFVIDQRLVEPNGSHGNTADDFYADPSLYPYLEAVLTDDADCDDDGDDVDAVLELMRAYVPLLEGATDAALRRWLAECRRELATATTAAATSESAFSADNQADVAVFAASVVGVRIRRSESSSTSNLSALAEAEAVAAAAAAESLDRLRALFPQACALKLRLRLSEAGGNLQQAAGLCLEVDNDDDANAVSLTCPKPPCACLAAPKPVDSASTASSVADVKSYIMSRFEHYELPDERKVHRPEARFDEKPRLTRYLDSRVVAQNGARFTQIKDEREEEIRKATTVCLKPARKYRFH